jgi:serine phosphatase RsbU (regulator of sigma subunit)
VEEVLGILTDAVLAGLGEWIVVALTDDVVAGLSEHESRASRRLEVMRAAHADPGRDDEVRAAVDVDAFPLAGLDPVAGPVALRAGSDEALALPLNSRGRLLGAVVVGRPAREELDRRLLQDLVMRAGSAVDNAVLYGAERRMGLTLQRSLIPAALPQLPHIQTAARYLPGTKGRHVGGDFYLGHRLQDGRLSLIIGDVMGHGMQAAARMGQLRAILTAYAYDGDPPDRVLTRLAARVEDLLDLPMATVLVSIYDPAARELLTASAGHLPPLIAPRDQEPAFAPMRPGPPLGVGPYSYAAHRIVLPPDATAVLYTDGLIEDRRRSIDAGLERLRRALADLRMPPEAVCDHVLAELGRTEGAEDDIALVVLHHD